MTPMLAGGLARRSPLMKIERFAWKLAVSAGNGGKTCTVTIDVAVPPWPSPTVYEKRSTPMNPVGGE